jgi:hypothetical protein
MKRNMFNILRQLQACMYVAHAIELGHADAYLQLQKNVNDIELHILQCAC